MKIKGKNNLVQEKSDSITQVMQHLVIYHKTPIWSLDWILTLKLVFSNNHELFNLFFFSVKEHFWNNSKHRDLPQNPCKEKREKNEGLGS